MLFTIRPASAGGDQGYDGAKNHQHCLGASSREEVDQKEARAIGWTHDDAPFPRYGDNAPVVQVTGSWRSLHA